MAKLSEEFRRAIDASSKSRYRLCKEAGISQGTMSRFMGGRGAYSDVLDKLAPVLGLELVSNEDQRKREAR